MKIHFINVGHGDCILIEFLDSGRNTVIDINNAIGIDKKTKNEMVLDYVQKNHSIIESYKISRFIEEDNQMLLDSKFRELNLSSRYNVTNPMEYFDDRGINNIFRFIVTHPHLDHISGIKCIENKFSNAWITKNKFENDSFKSDDDEENWNVYKKLRNRIGKDESPKILDVREGFSSNYYNEDGITILSPNSDLIEIAEDKNNPNIMSTVLLIEKGGKKIILGGDAERETWEYIYDHYKDELKDIDILKASHHGRDSGYHEEAVQLMNPKYTIVSVGKKPSTDASNKYKKYCDNVWSTRYKGNIIFNINSLGVITPETEHE